ncbi:septum site-determining protein MinC [Desertibacillus haloalkaliphilus]|uniref:septum site-determining protein MinC n=1 Tax=Desertibacillus haloalkaliphilus TaxID=1328930 RepID=UPI001C25B0B2|nr:septum site-determining protein MinC [Desertibacillus haloalkaliphilus]MBU8905037.1 septum site-determining protein MinC [Desertibacillus haloalkaliphilus]
MTQTKHYVTIKGTKDGLILMLDDRCSYAELIKELDEKLSSNHYQLTDGPQVSVKVSIGNRYLTDEQESDLKQVIVENKNLHVEQIDSNVISKVEAENIRKQSQIVSIARIIRSGQVLEITGDLLLIGDVNPGGTVIATGNIFVMGALKGVAHAGCHGDKQSVIASSYMAATQLRIAELVKYAPDHTEPVGYEMECAYIDGTEDEITLERVQQLTQLRPNLTRLESYRN